MEDADQLRSLGVDLSALDPAPPQTPRWDAGTERLKARHPCLLCGQPSSAVGIAHTPGHGRRWVGTCMPCLVATTPSGRTGVSLTDTLAVLREAAREVGAVLKIITDEA
ncbi:hypothetical protein [Streptomyces sp. ITFR-6]|uniref:hypothetical protein n=1 Tax=Streptomyces sp. ITFR-6 TaxID=3075197 RepID=UPI00288B6B4D|nr:hypothetical protein [Streptomyces sp. ITFR-6]WNI31502.1 hypothetical protein RLT59_23945 [Streptomyces sp. ITFR-6]